MNKGNKPVHIAVVQFNPTVGDMDGNAKRIIELSRQAAEAGAQIAIFPELAISGYLPQDLLFDKPFLEANDRALRKIIEATRQITVITGHVHRDPAKGIYNTAAVCQNGELLALIQKTLLPTYDVFDELRYFRKGHNSGPVSVTLGDQNLKLGIEICEDLWDADYGIKVTDNLAGAGADLIINISASPFCVGKAASRKALVREKINSIHLPFVYNNLVGAQDELIFDGSSFILDRNGHTLAQLPSFREDFQLYEVDLSAEKLHSEPIPDQEMAPMEQLYQALSLGIQDYFRKSGFTQCLLGLSGGIDSAVVAVLAAEALGPENVFAYSLPSRYSSDHSLSDAEDLAGRLRIRYDTIPIESVFSSFMGELQPRFAGLPFGLAEENLQARIRGTFLMSLANKFNRLLLSTANKTETALGYSTLYGDMAGALAPISDLNKQEVYDLSEWINQRSETEFIPRNIIEKMPSAELSEGQFDPFDYSIVSPLVEEILENRRSAADLVNMGYDKDLVNRIMTLIVRSEYKRKQAAPGLRVSEKAFGTGRRMPIINHYIDRL